MKHVAGRVALFVALALGGLRAQSTSQPAPPAFRSGASAIVVDVIVRDREGRPITDLTLQDFELREDGVLQEIRAMTMIAPEASGRTIAAPDRTVVTQRSVQSVGADAAPAGHSVVALVFDRLSPEARDLAQKAARSYLDRTHRVDDFVGVFGIDLSLETIQTYTNDRRKLSAALDDVAHRGSAAFGRRTSATRASTDPATPPTASAESPGQMPLDNPDVRSADAALAAVVARMERGFQKMEERQQGLATTHALQALVTSLGVLPGRKTIVFFAEGIQLPDQVMRSFDTLVEVANRRNVTIYTVDAAGLRVHSTQAAAGRVVADSSAGSVGAPASLEAGDPSLSERFERGLTAARSDPHASLSKLAELTGGFLVENTNNLRSGLARIEEDRRFHYLLTYSPRNTAFGGEYRRIAVTVKRRDARVRARSGYSAVHEPGAFPTLTYEVAALAMLERTPPPSDLPVTLQTLRLPQPKHPGRVALLVRVPGHALTWRTTADGTSYQSDFTILARITDAAGEVVRQAGQPYRLTGPIAGLEAARAGDVVFFRSPELPPGAYTVSYSVHDALADRASVGSAPIDVDGYAADALSVGDIVVIAKAERLPLVERDASNPLLVDDTLLYPRTGEPIAAGANATLPFFVSIRPSPKRPTLTTRLAIARTRQTVAQAPLTLDAPGADGVIRQFSRLSIGSLAPGSYALVLTVSDGASTTIRSAPFEISR
jgi:VWFA-related protein